MRWSRMLSAALIATLAGHSGCERLRGSEVHLIPEGFVGPVVILFGVPSGRSAPRDEEGAAVFEIPRDGVLLLEQEAPATGLYRKRFFYVSPSGDRVELPYKTDEDTLQVFADEVGVSEPGRDGGSGSLRWSAYVVGTPADHGEWARQRRQAVEDAVARARAGDQS